MSETMIVAPAHTGEVFNPNTFKNLVDKLVIKFKYLAKNYKINTLVGCGNSGVPIVSAAAYRLGVPFFAVRKSRSDTLNDDYMANGYVTKTGVRYLIVDDCIETGTTIKRIVKNMKNSLDAWTSDITPICVVPIGILLYGGVASYSDTNYKFKVSKQLTLPLWDLK
jgi:adenine/guanine phosphoribosyltransferase-like PRPP-binding protein